MQHIKLTEKLGEFQKFIDSENKTGLCLKATITVSGTCSSSNFFIFVSFLVAILPEL
jgi:hypothetical protein